MATLAHAGASLNGPGSRETKTSATALACRCEDASGCPDPSPLAEQPDRCGRCGKWLSDALGGAYHGSDLGGLASLLEAVEDVRRGLLEDATEAGVLDEDDYIAWLESRLARGRG